MTDEERQQRATDIAAALSDNNHWHSHGRMIGIRTLTEDLRLKIEDYSAQTSLREAVRVYCGLLMDYLSQQQVAFRIHYLGA